MSGLSGGRRESSLHKPKLSWAGLQRQASLYLHCIAHRAELFPFAIIEVKIARAIEPVGPEETPSRSRSRSHHRPPPQQGICAGVEGKAPAEVVLFAVEEEGEVLFELFDETALVFQLHEGVAFLRGHCHAGKLWFLECLLRLD